LYACFGTDFLGFLLWEGGWKGGVTASSMRGLGEITERTASFGYINVVGPSPAGDIQREGGSRPKVITLESIPVLGSQPMSVS